MATNFVGKVPVVPESETKFLQSVSVKAFAKAANCNCCGVSPTPKGNRHVLCFFSSVQAYNKGEREKTAVLISRKLADEYQGYSAEERENFDWANCLISTVLKVETGEEFLVVHHPVEMERTIDMVYKL